VSLLIVGCGYVGKAVAHHYLNSATSSHSKAKPRKLYALTRSSHSAEHLQSLGIQPIIGHWLNFEALPESPPDLQAVLVSVPHRADEISLLAADNAQQHVCGLQNLARWLQPTNSISVGAPLPRLIYLSTTGVYGSTTPGQRVDERSPIQPTRIGPQIAAAAEHWLQSHPHLWSSSILRLAGIYGPGRVPLMQNIREGRPLEVPESGTLNLIHLADIVQAIEWLMRQRSSESMYVLSDGKPVVRREFYEYLARLLGLPAPEFSVATGDNSKVKRASDKLVDSSRFWQHSGLQVRYPDYKAGLQQIVELQRSSGASNELSS
jgi:nucleoside-diphosphate-sugar epimerase